MNLEAMAPSMIVLRHSSSGACHMLARICRAAIINAGDGMHEHPTQALLDAFTIRERKGRLAGLKVAIVGDLLHSRVLRSNILLLTQTRRRSLGVRAARRSFLRVSIGLACTSTTSVDEAVEDADVIMMLRIQLERMQGGFFPSLREYFTTFGMTEAAREPRQARRHHHASGPDEPRRRDRVGGRRRSVLGDPRPGGKRCRRAHGRAVSARGRSGA